MEAAGLRPTALARAVVETLPDAAGSFERLFTEEYARVVGIAYRILADEAEAEDVAQEVFLALHRRRGGHLANAPAWLHAAAAHRALNQLRGKRRRARRELAHELAEPRTDAADPHATVEQTMRYRQVREALRRLPERSAAVLALRYGGLSYAEVASALGVKVGQVGTMLRRAEEALRQEVKE
jgi:RNA polymerase sigma-70 factor (ECF subfamily)